VSVLEKLAAGLLLAIGIIIAALLGAKYYGARQFAAGHAAAVDERARSDAGAVLTRARDNAVLATRQDKTNSANTKVKDDEVTDLRKRLAAAGRLRVGPTVCPGRPAAPAQAKSTAGGDGADSSTGLVSARADADFKQLIEAVETDLATGRACQRFLEANNLQP